MNRGKITIIAFVAVVTVLGSMATFMPPTTIQVSGVLEELSISDMAERSDYAIVGTVEKMTPVLVDMPKERDHDRVYTDVTLLVQEDLYGNYEQKMINFRILGGATDKLIMNVEQSPEFAIGEKVLVFLGANHKGYTFNGHNYLVGQAQSAFEITENGKAVDKYQGKNFNKELIITESKQIRGI